MDLGMTGKQAIVLGASQGLGRAIAVELAREGCNLLLVARNEGKLNGLAAELAADYGVETAVHAIDLGDPVARAVLLDKINTLKQVDILISNTGGPPPGRAPGIPAEVWRSQFEKMIVSLIEIMDGCLVRMRAQKWGRIITIASSGVQVPIPTIPLSNSLRSTLVAYSKTVAAEVAADGVTLNVLLPGRIDTERVRSLDESRAATLGITPEEAREQSLGDIPAGRLGTPAEFAAAAVFLASTRASYMTGNVIRVDGGMTKAI